MKIVCSFNLGKIDLRNIPGDMVKGMSLMSRHMAGIETLAGIILKFIKQ